MEVLDKLRKLAIRAVPSSLSSSNSSDGGRGAITTTPKVIQDRLRVVFAKPVDVARDFAAVLFPKSDQEREFLEKALNQHFLFSKLSHKEKMNLIHAMELITSVKQGTTLIREGDVGDYLYVIYSGTVRFMVDKKNEGTASTGAIVGELALLYDCPRAATVLAETDLVLYRVSQYTFRRIKAAHTLQNDHETRTALRKVRIFQDLPDEYIQRLADSLFEKKFKQGDVLVSKGEEVTAFFIIKEGYVIGTDISIGSTKYADKRVGPNEFFGERPILTGEPMAGTVTAETDGSAWFLTKERFVRTLGHLNLEELTRKAQDMKFLSVIPLFAYSDVDNIEIGLMASKIQDKEFTKGTEIAKEGWTVTPALYIIRSGTVVLSKEGSVIKELQPGEIFGFGGETLILTNALKGKNMTWKEHGLVALTTNATALLGETQIKHNAVLAQHDVVVSQDAKLGILTLKAVSTVLYDVMRLGRDKRSVLNPNITKDSLAKMRLLGAGTFGQVWLTRDTKTEGAYAMKVQFKRELIEYGQAQGVIREKQVMERMNHPFVMSIVNAHQDSTCLYLIMDLIQGGELSSQMRSSSQPYMSETNAKFYASCILDGLSYMHRRNYVYRDLKGENVLLDKDGYCVIVDLGFAKYVPERTFTFCGTPVFIAPEVVLCKGHNKSADIWSFGVLIYEMITGANPFFDYNAKTFDQRTLFKRILSGKFTFPSSQTPNLSAEAKDLIRKLLVLDVNERLGCLANADLDIREHPWFASMDFCRLYKKELSPPWVPVVKDPFDCGNYAKWQVEEKVGLKPLSDVEQMQFKDF